MKEGAKIYVGIDIAKEHLDAAAGSAERRFGNDAKGVCRLAGWLRQRGAEVQVICEASGGYERRLVQGLQREGIAVSLVQASRVRQFARASGWWAKTDQIDARLLSAFGEALQPAPRRVWSPEQEKLSSWTGSGDTWAASWSWKRIARRSWNRRSCGACSKG